MPKISIVSPVYKAEKIVELLVSEIQKHVSPVTSNFEIILVEDGSPDKSWDKIEKICLENEKVIGIKLSRNFGQHYAITAGLESAKGEWIVVMDCDLQDRPEEIKNLYEKAFKEKLHLVFARRMERRDTWIKRLSSYLFYKTFGSSPKWGEVKKKNDL